MGRIPRVYINNVAYHLIVRGNHKKRVFSDDEDFERYINIMNRAKNKYKVRLYCYCIMPNHVHLLVKPDQAKNISKFMHWTNKGYTEHFNAKYSKVGHLWQGRFRSKPILQDDYLTTVAGYIENNPVRAKLVENAPDYTWSSYRERNLLNISETRILLDK